MFELFDPNDDVHIREGSNLPHWFQPGVTYFVTFRTDDSIPESVARHWHAARNDWLVRHGISPADGGWQRRLEALSRPLRREFHDTFTAQYLNKLDQSLGECVLRRAELSEIVRSALLHFDGDRYHMGDFVVMPNHVHLVVGLLGDTEIEKVCESWKRYTARKINGVLERAGRFWQEESFDHLIRSPDQFEAIGRYIASNPRALAPGEYVLRQRK